MPHTTQIQTSCHYWFTLDPVLLSHKEWGTRPQELGSKFSCFPWENFFITLQLLFRKAQTCCISKLDYMYLWRCWDYTVRSVKVTSGRYWERLSHELTAVRKLREASLPYNMQLCSKSSHVCRATSASKWGAIEETPYTPHLPCEVFHLHTTSHHRCDINNFYRMKLYQKIHHRKTVRISTANQHQIHRSKSI